MTFPGAELLQASPCAIGWALVAVFILTAIRVLAKGTWGPMEPLREENKYLKHTIDELQKQNLELLTGARVTRQIVRALPIDTGEGEEL